MKQLQFTQLQDMGEGDFQSSVASCVVVLHTNRTWPLMAASSLLPELAV